MSKNQFHPHFYIPQDQLSEPLGQIAKLSVGHNLTTQQPDSQVQNVIKPLSMQAVSQNKEQSESS